MSDVPANQLFDAYFTAAPMRAVFSDRGRLQGMLDFEAALVRAEARTGVVPATAVAPIEAACRAELYDPLALAEAVATAGNSAIPLVKALGRQVAAGDAEAERYVHLGATSQDAMDSGLVLQLRRALALLEQDLQRLAEVLADQAERHADTPLAGRTWLQHATPVTLGMKLAGLLGALTRHRQRLRELRPRLLVLQFGGASGTLAALGEQALPVAAALAEELGLALPEQPWHTQRDRLVEFASVLGLVAGSLGKFGRDVSLLMQTEAGEVFEPAGAGRGGSSTMPHKRNPVSSAVLIAAATRAPGLVSTLFAAMPQEHERSLGLWHAEWETLPELCCLVAGALQQAIGLLEGLEVDAQRMRRTGGTVLPPRRRAAPRVARGARRRGAGERRVVRRRTGPPARSRPLPRPGPRLGRARARRTPCPGLRTPSRLTGDPFVPTVRLADGDLNYSLEGPAGAPVLLLSNSLGTDLGMWDTQIPALTAHFRVLRYDTRGHGASLVTPGPYAIGQLGADVLALLDALELPRVHFCGLSMGGLIGQWLGIHAGERLGRLVLCNTAAKIASDEVWNTRIDTVLKGGEQAMRDLRDASVARWFTAGFAEREPAQVERIVAMLAATSPQGYAANCAAVRDADFREQLGLVQAPTLIVAGSHDAVTTPDNARFMQARIADAQLVEFAAAHLSNVEAGDAFSRRLVDFLLSA